MTKIKSAAAIGGGTLTTVLHYENGRWELWARLHGASAVYYLVSTGLMISNPSAIQAFLESHDHARHGAIADAILEGAK